jgi:hypothetical protein
MIYDSIVETGRGVTLTDEMLSQEFYQQNCLPLSYINANPHEPIQVNPEELSFARSLANAHPRLDKSAMKNQLKRFLVDDDDVGMTEENVSKKANRFAVD